MTVPGVGRARSLATAQRNNDRHTIVDLRHQLTGVSRDDGKGAVPLAHAERA